MKQWNNETMNETMNEAMNAWMNERMNAWMHECMNEWMNAANVEKNWMKPIRGIWNDFFQNFANLVKTFDRLDW
jgi:hypothetical protein